MSVADVYDEVLQAVAATRADPAAGSVDVDAAVRDLVDTVGLEHYAALGDAEFWAILARHTQPG